MKNWESVSSVPGERYRWSNVVLETAFYHCLKDVASCGAVRKVNLR